MSRLTIVVTEQQHQTLKAMAALAGQTIKQYQAAEIPNTRARITVPICRF